MSVIKTDRKQVIEPVEQPKIETPKPEMKAEPGGGSLSQKQLITTIVVIVVVVVIIVAAVYFYKKNKKDVPI